MAWVNVRAIPGVSVEARIGDVLGTWEDAAAQADISVFTETPTGYHVEGSYTFAYPARPVNFGLRALLPAAITDADTVRVVFTDLSTNIADSTGYQLRGFNSKNFDFSHVDAAFSLVSSSGAMALANLVSDTVEPANAGGTPYAVGFFMNETVDHPAVTTLTFAFDVEFYVDTTFEPPPPENVYTEGFIDESFGEPLVEVRQQSTLFQDTAFTELTVDRRVNLREALYGRTRGQYKHPVHGAMIRAVSGKVKP